MAGTGQTSITRAGGYLIRVGWRAKGYSVDEKTENRFRLVKLFLVVLSIVVGLGVAWGADYLLFEVLGPMVRSRTALVVSYPTVWKLLILGLTFVCGWLVLQAILAAVGAQMVKGFDKWDDGLSFLEQRRRASLKRKREYIVILLLLALILSPYNPFGDWPPLGPFIALVLLARIAEGVLLNYVLKK